MKIEIIIPVHNRRENLEKTLRCLSAQNIRPEHTVNIIVVDHGSTDGTTDIRVAIPSLNFSIQYFSIPRDKWSASIPRNFGVKQIDTDAEYLLFLDSDILLPPDRIQRYIDDYLADPDPMRVIIGPYHYAQKPIDTNDTDWYKRDINHYQQDVRWASFVDHPVTEKNKGVGFALACFGGSLFIPKGLFFKAGGYDEHITSGCEDGDFGLTLWETGAVFSMDKGLLGWHHPHVITPDRTSDIPQMVKYIDDKHNMDLVKASGEAYRQWNISWEIPEQWKEKQSGS